MAKEGQAVNYGNVSREYKKEMLHTGVYLETDRMIKLFKLPVIRKDSLFHLVISVSLCDTML
jgi:hypothetical protein